MTETQLLVDGALVPAATATISALDRGFRSGEGLYETLRIRDSRAFRLGAHLDRLVGTAERLGIPLDRVLLGRGIATVVAANHHLGADVAVRITCSAGPMVVDRPFPAVAGDGTAPTVVMSVQPLVSRGLPAGEAGAPGARGLLVDLRRELAWAKSTAASLVALVAQRTAVAQGATDAILCDARGAPLEASTANLFVVHGDRLVTPPPEAGILDGVTRAAVLDLAPGCGVDPVERPLDREVLRTAQEAFLTSAVRGIRPLIAVDGRPIGTGEAGPVTRRLTAAYAASVATDARPVDDPLSWSSGG